jgi:hypothetical protein
MRRLFANLRLRLILLVLVAALPAFGLILWNSFEQRKDERAHAQEKAVSLSQIVAGEQGQFVEGTRGLLSLLAGLAAPALAGEGPQESIDAESCNRAFAGVLAQDDRYTNIGIAGRDGTVLPPAKEQAA